MDEDVTLYEQIGGAAVLAAAVDEFYLRVLGNAKLAAFFAQSSLDDLKEHQRAFLAMLLHGPDGYNGRSMREAHAGLRISDADFDRMVAHLTDSLAAAGVGDTLIGDVIGRVRALRPAIVGAEEVA
jgi:hemoglobin